MSGTAGTTTNGGGRVNGGTVTFVGDSGVTVTAAGGQGGANAYINGANSTTGQGGGTGGAAASSVGDVVFAGGAGSAGNTGGTNVSGSGGGGAGNASAGGAGFTSTADPYVGAGAGGSVGGGAGGVGRTGNPPTSGNTNAGPGNPGVTPGGGGGGGKNQGQNTRLGGTGGLGQIVITYEVPVSSVKANNVDDLNLGTSWVGGQLPNASGNAIWDETVTSSNTTSLGGNVTFGALVIEDPAGPVTVNAGNTLTLGNALVDIDMSVATQNLTLNCDLALGGPNVWNIASGRTLTLGGIVSGLGATIQGAGTTIFQGANTFTGSLVLSGGTLRLAGSELIPHGTGTGNVTIDGTLDLNGFSEQINGLNGLGIVDTTAADTSVTLTVGGNNQAGTFSGSLQNSGSGAVLALTKTGTGAATLSGAGSYSGVTTVNSGALVVQNASALGSTAAGTVVNGSATGSAQNARVDLSGGITVTGEAITITGVGNFSGALSSASGANEWAGPVTIAPAGAGITRLGALAASTLTVSGVVDSGAVDTGLIIRTANVTDSTVILSAPNTYIGDTWVAVGKLQLAGGNNRLPVATKVRIGAGTNLGEFDLNGVNQEIAGLSIEAGATAANNSVNNSSGTPSVLTVNTTTPSTFAGILKGNLSLVKSGLSTLTLAGANTQTGTTSVTAGSLMLSTAGSGVSDIEVSTGASVGALVAAADGKFFNVGDLTLGSGSILTIDYGGTTPSTTVAPFDVNDFNVGTGLSLALRGINLGSMAVSQSYPLVTWAGTGPIDGTSFTALLNPRVQGTFSVSGKTLFFTVSANSAIAPIQWNTGDGVWNTVTANWLDSIPAATTFFDTFDSVRFGDAAGVVGNPVITLASSLSPAAVVMNSTGHDYTLTGGGISGTTGLTLDAANTRKLTLLSVNAYTGATAVNGGTLELGNGGTLPAASALSIGTGATFSVNRSDTATQGVDFSTAAISGAGTFVQAGSGTTILNAGNTLSGLTDVLGGTLQANLTTTGSGIGTSAPLVASGATLLLNNTNTSSTAVTVGNSITGIGLLKLQFAAGTTARNTQMPGVTSFAGTIQLSSLGLTGDKWTASGLGAIAGSLIVDSGNTLFVGSGSPSFTGGITLSGIGNSEGRGAIRLSNASLGGNITLAGSTTINLDNTAAVLSGNITSGSVDPVTLTLGATGSTGGTLSGAIGGGTGTISVATAVAGTYTLSGDSTYSGGTTLNAGIINVNHSNALGTGVAGFGGGVRYVIGNGVNVPNAFVLGPNANVAGNGMIQVADGNTGTVSGPITITNGSAAGGHFATLGTGVLNLTGPITSSINVVHRIGTIVLSGGGTGYTSITNGQGTIRLGANDGVATTATMNIGTAGAAILDLAGFNQSLVGVTKASNAATIGNSSTISDSILTTTGTSSFAGVIQDVVGSGTMKVGLAVASGQLTLTGANTFSGNITVSGGTLVGAGATNSPGVTVFGARDSARTITVGSGGVLQFASGNILGANHAATTAPTIVINNGATVTNAAPGTNNALNNVEINGGTLTATTGSASGYAAWNLNGTVTSTGGSTISTSDPVNGTVMLKVAGATEFNVVSDTLTVSAPLIDNMNDSNSGGLTKSGAGTMVISGANTYSGITTVNGGVLALGASGVIPDASDVVLGAGTLDVGAFTETARTLDLTAAATIDLEPGGVIAFAGSSSVDWTGGSLNITGAFVPGVSIRFGTSDAGLDVTQLALITVNGSGSYKLDPAGYLIEAPAGGYASWQEENGTTGGINDDHDGDGVPNGVEFFLGGNGNTTGFTALPGVDASVPGVLSVTWVMGAGYDGVYGTDFVVETSDSLTGAWTAETLGGNVTLTGSDLKFTYPTPLDTRRFARLRVTGP